jgi:Protein of unknown function (DUF2914)
MDGGGEAALNIYMEFYLSGRKCMKHFLSWSGVCIAIVSICLLVPYSIQAQQTGNLNVATAVICKNVADRQPVAPGTSFSASVGRLYCYSKIADIQDSTKIVHVWYFGDRERARTTLSVNPPSWRTFSSKIIQAQEIGKWHVKILDASGNMLQDVEFEITP